MLSLGRSWERATFEGAHHRPLVRLSAIGFHTKGAKAAKEDEEVPGVFRSGSLGMTRDRSGSLWMTWQLKIGKQGRGDPPSFGTTARRGPPSSGFGAARGHGGV